MGPLIDQVAAIVAGVQGIAAVHQSLRQPINSTPAALIEAVCEDQAWERELGARSLRLELRLSIAVVQALPTDPADIPAARDLAMSLARTCRAALAADPSLGGACLTSRVQRSDFAYITIGGTDYAQALTLLEAIKEQAL